MAKNEVGEFELVLGNKQLLSVFFIVVVLLGVFFTMGYIVGRNSGGAGTLEAANRKPTIVDSPGASSPAPAPSTPEPEPKREEPAAPAPVVETPKVDEKVAAKEAAAKREAEQRLADEKIAEERKAETKRLADEKKGDKAGAEAPPRAPSGPLSGTYLQIAAVPRTEADLLINVLQKKGFKAAAGPGPEGSNLFRVLVGPLSGADAISSTRTSLNDAGMQGSKAIVKRF